MKKELAEYIKTVKQWLAEGKVPSEILEDMKINIGFFQHERLIHLIVTMTFAVLVLFSLLLFTREFYFLPLFLLFLGLEIPYIIHYYTLENGVQELQRLYREVMKKSDEKNE